MKFHIALLILLTVDVVKILRKKRMEKGLIKLLLPPPVLVTDLHQTPTNRLGLIGPHVELFLPSGSLS